MVETSTVIVCVAVRVTRPPAVGTIAVATTVRATSLRRVGAVETLPYGVTRRSPTCVARCAASRTEAAPAPTAGRPATLMVTGCPGLMTRVRAGVNATGT